MNKGGLQPHIFETFLYWMRERENIRLKKNAEEPPPWTTDPILTSCFFTNVRRRDDRVSQWIIGHIIEPFAEHSNLWIMLALARLVNWPDTLLELMKQGLWPTGAQPAWTALGEALDARTARGEKTWTAAYQVLPSNKSESKGAYVTRVLMGTWSCREQILAAIQHNRLEAAHRALTQLEGWGSFMAGQAVADWTYTPLLCHAEDLYTWAPLGLGSQRGLNRLFGNPLGREWTQEEAVVAMREVRTTGLHELGAGFEDLTLHDWQHSICELDKSLRYQNGERPKRRYSPAPMQASLFG